MPWLRRCAALGGLLASVACGSGNESMTTQERTVALAEIEADGWRRLATRRIFFGHQSVGGNLLEGVRAVLAEHPDVGLRVVETSDPEVMDAPGLYHALVGENGAPDTKLQAFVEIAGPGVGDSGIALLKYCYVDVTGDTDPVALFEQYHQAVEALRETHPGLTLVHVTLPLQADYGTLFHYRTILRGRHTPLRRLNYLREQYNVLLRSAYAGRDPVFDLAHLESLDPQGNVVSVRYRGQPVPVLATDWTDDGGHLNAAGRRRMGEAFLALLAGL